MPITVRYPDGQAVRYNAAMFVELWGNSCWMLRDKPGGTALAVIAHASGAAIEFVSPCEVSNPLASQTVDDAIRMLLDFAEQPHSFQTNHRLGRLKALLSRFNARTFAWRPAK